jgi:hypothetical protein
MISQLAWYAEYQLELEHALAARAGGNEGMARVCARRATSVIIGEYLQRLGYSNLSNSIYERIAIFNSLPNLDLRCKEIVNHMLIKVNPDHALPMEADLIAEVKWLAKTLLFVSGE